jgi:hypothetical protein
MRGRPGPPGKESTQKETLALGINTPGKVRVTVAKYYIRQSEVIERLA